MLEGDGSSRGDEPFEVELRKGKDPHEVLAELHRMGLIQNRLHVRSVVVADGAAREMGILEIMTAHLDRRRILEGTDSIRRELAELRARSDPRRTSIGG